MLVICDNCCIVQLEEDLKIGLADIKDLLCRIEPGGVVPSGECPECEALMYRYLPEEA